MAFILCRSWTISLDREDWHIILFMLQMRSLCWESEKLHILKRYIRVCHVGLSGGVHNFVSPHVLLTVSSQIVTYAGPFLVCRTVLAALFYRWQCWCVDHWSKLSPPHFHGFCTDMSNSAGTDPNDFGDPLTFLVEPPWCSHMQFRMHCLSNFWMIFSKHVHVPLRMNWHNCPDLSSV